MKQKIDSFRGKYFFLSNFYPAKVSIFDNTFLNTEAAFQSAKVIDERAEKQLEISRFTQLNPSQAKSRGRHVKLRHDWESVKDDIMYQIVYAKFAQNTNLKDRLLKTGDSILIEGNTWHDYYWGRDISSGKGKNKLGQILMTVRSELK